MTDVTTLHADDVLTRQVKRINYMLLVVLAALVFGPIIGSWYISRQLPVVSTVTIDNVQLISSAELCPGEPLVYQYAFHAQGTGVLVRDRVLWRVSPPPKTMIYSVSRRFILSEPIDQNLIETWHVPATYINPETDAEEALPPGDYRLIFAISSPSRSTVVAIAAVNFVIKDNCNE